MLERIAGKALLRFLSKYFILPGDVQKEDKSNDASIPSDIEPTTNGSERQRVQSTLLSKTQVAVWSGFVSLENLQLRHSLANDLFQKKGLPFELISGTIKAAEITVPWRQLRSFLSGNSSALNGDAKSKGETTGSDETDVIIVLDGISLLFTTKYEFYDEKLKESGKLSRRKELEEAMAFMTDPSSSSPASSSSRSFQSYLKQRLLSENLLNELFDNLTNRIQIHLRNLHIRLEDLESDPTHPWSMGITLESLHITSELDSDIEESFETRPFPDRPNNSNNEDAKIRRVLAQKLIQINHFSIYCNAIDLFYDDSPDPKIRRGSDITDSSEVGDGCNGNHASSSPSSPPPPPELLPIQCLYDQPDLLSRAMLSGIPRRHPRSLQQNKSNGHCPLHTFLLHPLEATCKALLSKPSSATDSNCDTTRAKAKLEATTQIPSLHIGLTPSTLVQILSFHARVKHHLSLKRHRIHRPQKDKTPITHPRLWWKYAAKCILRELREGGSGAYKSNRKVRWNWGRWHERVHLRKIYGELYQRWMEYGVSESCENSPSTASTGLNGNHHINGATSPSAAHSNGNHHSNASMNVMDDNGISLSAKSPNQSTHNTTQEVSNILFERPLSLEEFKEMNAIEDGSVGDLSVRDILLFRAVVRAKLKKSSPENARSKSSGQNAISSKTSSPLSKSRHRLTDYLRGVLKTERLDGQEECIRLVQYLEKKEEEDAEKEHQLQQQQQNQGTNFSGSTHSRNMLSVLPFETMIVVSVQTHVEKGSISLSMMLPNTSYSVSLKAPPQQQHFCFFDISFDKLGSKYSILENFESIILEASIHDYRGKEFRSDGSCNVVFSRSNSASTVTAFEDLMLPLNLAKGNNASSLKPLPRQDRSFKRTPSENKQSKLDCIAPIFQMNFMWNPPGDSVDASIILFQEKILFYVNPGCEWPRRFRDMFSISDLLRAAKPPDVNSFWEDLQMAYINSWKSTKASLTAKAEQALLKQRKFDADIRFDLPSLTILDDHGTSVTIDMGTAILVTEHLAGVPKDDDTNLCGKPSGYIPKLTKESSQVDGPITGIAAESPSTPTRGTSSCHLLFSPGTTLCSESPHTGGVDCVSIGESASALSMDSGRRRRGRSFGLHEVKLFSVAENESIVGEDTELQNADQHELIQCFYDSYRVSVGVINISISQGNSESFSLFTGSGLDFFLKKSIIPSDQNLPRLRLSSQVNAISIYLSRDSLIRLGLLIKKLRSDFETKSPHCHNRQPSQKFGQFETAQSPGEIESTDSTSIIDENEFLDAIDEYEPDYADDWFEQKWIPDIESKSFGDITMNTFSRNERRLRFPSISEVSSKSDRRESYLSAENLAKLEDLPIGTNDTGFGASQVSCGDEDSFYSVISLDDEKKLKNAIASDILKAEEEVGLVKEKIKRTAESYIEKWQNDGETISKQEIYKQRNTKKALKLELLRAEAELNALKACYRELAAQVALDNLPERVKLDLSQSPIDSAIDQGKSSAGAESVTKSLYHETFSRAKSLMKAREKRASVARTISPTKKLPDQHNLIESLNKDLVFSSMIVSSVIVKFCEDDIVAKDLTTDYGAIAILELSDARLVAHIRRYDRSVFSSIGKICAWSNVSGHFFLGGLPCDETHQTLCSQYPHLFPVDTQDEQFCRIQWKCIKSRKNSKNTIQLSFGPIEGTPSNSLADLVTLVKPTRQAKENPADIAADDPITKIACVLMGTGPIKSDSSLNPKVHYSIDLNCRFSSFCVRVGDDAQDKVGAIVISGLRFGISRRSGPLNYRGQLDTKISNIQILNVTEKVCELFGQRSIYDDMFVGRIRIQLAPKSECGGWVVESTGYKPVEHDDDDSVWDLHVGAKIHSPATVVSPDLIEVMNCIKITANAFRTEETHDATRFNQGHHLRSNRSLPIRWRIDTSMIDAFIILPGKDCNFSGVNDVIGNNICLAWTTEALICQDYCHGTIVVSGVVRPSIDAITPRISANVLIPCTLNIDALLSPDLLKVERILDASLPGLSPPSRWTSPDLSSKLDENDLPIQDGIHIELSLTASPITFNLSSLLLRLANETRNHIKKVSFSACTSDSVHTQNSPRNTLASLKINLPSLDIKIVDMELNRTPSIPFVLLSVNTTYVEFMPGDDQTSVLFSIKDIQLFEVKNGVGIPVFYTSPIISEGADNSYDDESYFHASITKITKKLLPSSVDLSSRIGKSFVLMLPEVVQKMMDFFNAIKFKDKQTRDTDVGVTNDRTIGLPFDASLIRFKACFNGINIMLPSQNVYNVMDNCEENQTDILHVVCIDWNFVFNGTLVSCNEKRNGFTPVTAIIQTEEKNILDTWDELVKRIGGDEGITQSNDNCDGNSLLASKIDWKSLDFQIMRTCVLLHRSKAMDRLPFKSTFSLEKTTGLFSDQKIIYPFQLSLVLSCVVFSEGNAHDHDNKLSSSYGIQFDVSFVELIWHLARSRHGLSDAYEVSISPILDILKRSEGRVNRNDMASPEMITLQSVMQTSSPIEHSQTSFDDQKRTTIKIPKSVYMHFQQAMMVISARLDGVQVTCVPSNATAVNLIPIVKVQLSSVRFGSMVMACPSDGGVDIISKSRESTSDDGYQTASLYFSAWSESEISAHYHNLRLLMWEPLIETWGANTRSIANLSEILQVDPYPVGTKHVSSPKSSNAVDFTRLIRFILARGNQLDKTGIVEANAEPVSAEVNGLDVCYVLQCLISPGCTWLAKCPSINNVTFSFPSENEFVHLLQHGCPTHSGNDKISAMLRFNYNDRSASAFNTQQTLNINITGAFFDTLAFSELGSKPSTSKIAAHSIRNESGLFMRWSGELDEIGELPTGREAPLSLKRGFPHRAFICLEFWDKEPKVNESPTSFKATGRVPVDLIGLNKYALRTIDGEHQPTIWIIVRVFMSGSAKVVSIESPAFVSNVTSHSLNIRMYNKATEVFQVTLPPKPPEDTSAVGCTAPIPATLVPFVNSSSWKLSVPCEGGRKVFESDGDVSFPKPFSKTVTSKGLISSKQVSFSGASLDDCFSINACAIRIGNEAIPEQRLLAFRNTIVVRNNLPHSIFLQVRVKIDASKPYDEWIDMGRIVSGHSIPFSRARCSDDVECRIKVLIPDEDNWSMRPAEIFPYWSSSLFIPPEDTLDHTNHFNIVINDHNNVPLQLRALVETDTPKHHGAQSRSNDVRSYQIGLGQRVVSIYSPFIIADHTGQNIEFKSNKSIVAGQREPLGKARLIASVPQLNQMTSDGKQNTSWPGLSNVRKHQRWRSPMDTSAEIFMLGGENTTNLTVRQSAKPDSQWSRPISISSKRAVDRIIVPRLYHPLPPLILCSRMHSAPEQLGGIKTTIISLFNKFCLVNLLDVEIEIISTNKRGFGQNRKPLTIGVNKAPIPWHFDDSGYCRLRPKELGWSFSGLVSMRKKRRDVSLRVRNKLTGKAIIVTIEFNRLNKTPNVLVVIRASRSIPFRLENLTTTPLQFTQPSFFGGFRSRGLEEPTILLPYHKAFYSWDFPDLCKRFILLEKADFEFEGHPSEDRVLARLFLDYLAPGTELKIENANITVSIVTDGSTRVLRVIDASISTDALGNSMVPKKCDDQLKCLFDIELNVGASLIDWGPRELVYFRLSELRVHILRLSDAEFVNVSIGQVSADCQLWLTPYPILLSIGNREEHKKDAFSASWCLDLVTRSNRFYQLLRNVEVKVDTLKLKIDGHLASLIAEMFYISSGLLGRRKEPKSTIDFDYDFNQKLTYAEDTAVAASKMNHYSFDDNNPMTITSNASENNRSVYSFISDEQRGVTTKVKQKYYIEKIKISSIKAEISWCGSLPLTFLLPRWLSPALMFDALPIMFPAYSNSHVYGSVEDHLENIKSHYNIWRFLFGLSFKPTFVLKSCIFTSMQSIASFLNNISGASALALDNLSGQHRATRNTGEKSFGLVDAPSCFFSPIASFVLRKLLRASMWASSLFDFAKVPGNDSSAVRIRAPRLFANHDQNDLLVEYVEGENAGKALLSRVRSGHHLYEGYVGHGIIDGMDGDSPPSFASQLCFILTFERLLVVTNGENVNVCDVAWEVLLDDITMVHLSEAIDLGGRSFFQVWYLENPEESIQASSPWLMPGLDSLSQRKIYFRESHSGRQLLKKASSVARFCMSVEQ